MKLRKALEKAKLSRRESGAGNGHRRHRVVEKSPDREWKPPVYADSVPAEVNPDLVCRNRFVCIDQTAPEIDFYKVLRTRIKQALQAKLSSWT